jgi:hypothetical protein
LLEEDDEGPLPELDELLGWLDEDEELGREPKIHSG